MEIRETFHDSDSRSRCAYVKLCEVKTKFVLLGAYQIEGQFSGTSRFRDLETGPNEQTRRLQMVDSYSLSLVFSALK